MKEDELLKLEPLTKISPNTAQQGAVNDVITAGAKLLQSVLAVIPGGDLLSQQHAEGTNTFRVELTFSAVSCAITGHVLAPHGARPLFASATAKPAPETGH